MVKAFFLDRDGVIINDRGHVYKISDIEILPGVGKAIKHLNDSGYKVVVVTNQAIVARGLCSEDDVIKANLHIQSLLDSEDARIDSFYYCPHHPSLEGNPKYKKNCNCRKPKPGMILEGAKCFGITNLGECFMVGDKISDIEAGKKAGCKTVLVNYDLKSELNCLAPDYVYENLYQAVKTLI